MSTEQQEIGLWLVIFLVLVGAIVCAATTWPYEVMGGACALSIAGIVVSVRANLLARKQIRNALDHWAVIYGIPTKQKGESRHAFIARLHQADPKLLTEKRTAIWAKGRRR